MKTKLFLFICVVITLIYCYNTKSLAEQMIPEEISLEEKFLEEKFLEEIEITEYKLSEEEIEQQKEQEPSNLFEWEDDLEIPSIHEESINNNRRSVLPTTYDARNENIITPIKDQGIYGTCWAVSVSQMAETSLLKKGLEISGLEISKDKLDLSERHFAYFFYHTVNDPLGNIEGDRTINSLEDSRSYLDVGGNHIFSTFALANRVGMAKEEIAPWEEILANGTNGTELLDTIAYSNSVVLENAYWINFHDTEDVKKAIIEYGSVLSAHYYRSSYFNYNTAAYYNPSNTSDNHSILIIGWDDDFDATNFGSDPGRNGAWLVKNSYGNLWGDEGYFWISYADMSFNKSTAAAYVFDFEAENKYENFYQYDGTAGRYIGQLGDSYINKVESGGAIANVFSIPRNAKAMEEKIEAVSFSILGVHVNYKIQLYKNLSDAKDPTSGEAMLSTPITGTTAYAGYYTIPISQDIKVKRGENFSAVIEFESENGMPITYFSDYSYQNGSWIAFESKTNENQSFVKNTIWEDLHDVNATARIKVFTKNDRKPNTYQVNIEKNEEDGGVVEGEGSYEEGTQVIIKAIPNKDYEFESFTEDGLIRSSEDILVIEEIKNDLNLTANFRKYIMEEKPKEPEIIIEEEEPAPEIELEIEVPPLREEENRVEEEPKEQEEVTDSEASNKEKIKTGDTNNILIYIVLAFISFAISIAFAILYYLQKHK